MTPLTELKQSQRKRKFGTAVLYLSMLFTNELLKLYNNEFGTPPEEAAELDAGMVKILLAGLVPQEGCDLKPYAPVLVNILEHELEGGAGGIDYYL